MLRRGSLVVQGDVGKIYKALASQQHGHGVKLQVRCAPLVLCPDRCAWLYSRMETP